MTLRFFKGEGQWIYLPKEVQLYISQDGEEFSSLAVEGAIKGDTKVVETKISLKDAKGRYIKVVAKNHGLIAEGKQGAGNRAWLFVDEIRLN